MANSDVSVRDTQLEKQRLGYIALSFSNMDNTSEPKIQAGSVVEIAGTLYSVSSEESNLDWGTIDNSTQAYLILDPAADGSSFSAKWSDSAPVWSEAKYGWYGDGTNEDADNRYVLRCYKTSGGDYSQKLKYTEDESHKNEVFSRGADLGGNDERLKVKFFNGSLDGDGDAVFAHGLSFSSIHGISVLVLDVGTDRLYTPGQTSASGEIYAYITITDVYLEGGSDYTDEYYRAIIWYKD